MKGAEATGGGGGGREGKGSDVAYRQELARLTHDHTHTGRYTYNNMYTYKYVL